MDNGHALSDNGDAADGVAIIKCENVDVLIGGIIDMVNSSVHLLNSSNSNSILY